MLQVALALKGYSIRAEDGALGSVSDFLFDDQTWKLRWLVVDTGGWLTGRKVLIHPSAIGPIDYEREVVPVRLTKIQVEDSPDIAQDRPVSRQMESDLYGYYGYDPLWGGNLYGMGALAYPLTRRASETDLIEHRGRVDGADEEDPHLRSVAEVTGYHVHATDGEIGHVENLLIDSQDWNVRYLIVDTSNWWIGKHVLVAPSAARRISWEDRAIEFDITRDQVRSSPPWDPLVEIDRYYEQRLHSHYGWLGYGW